MSLRQDYDDALRAYASASDTVAAWSHTLDQAHLGDAACTIAEARNGLALSRRYRAECHARLRATERATIEAKRGAVMILRQDYDDARREAVWALNDVRTCSQRLEFSCTAGYDLTRAHAELVLAREKRDKCEAKVRAAERALTEAGEVQS